MEGLIPGSLQKSLFMANMFLRKEFWGQDQNLLSPDYPEEKNLWTTQNNEHEMCGHA